MSLQKHLHSPSPNHPELINNPSPRSTPDCSEVFSTALDIKLKSSTEQFNFYSVIVAFLPSPSTFIINKLSSGFFTTFFPFSLACINDNKKERRKGTGGVQKIKREMNVMEENCINT
jgi:hypothetical protein